MDIRIGAVGRIVSGDYAGWYVKVQDDSENTGGFLILISGDRTFQSGKGFDGWVEGRAMLEGYFRESSWQVEWE
jgi:hypothetical protein